MPHRLVNSLSPINICAKPLCLYMEDFLCTNKLVSFRQRIGLSVASGAALAMRLVQIHLLQEGGGNIASSTSLFQPLRSLPHIQVPTLPSITFHYQTENGDISQGIFDLLFFSLKPNVTEVADVGAQAERYADIFNLIDVIHHPLMLSQRRSAMTWPGDGGGQRGRLLLAGAGGGAGASRCPVQLRHVLLQRHRHGAGPAPGPPLV